MTRGNAVLEEILQLIGDVSLSPSGVKDDVTLSIHLEGGRPTGSSNLRKEKVNSDLIR